jgi:hypothetical protein
MSVRGATAWVVFARVPPPPPRALLHPFRLEAASDSEPEQVVPDGTPTIARLCDEEEGWSGCERGAPVGSPWMGDEEQEKDRLDRKLIELPNELRIVIPGVQVLFDVPRDRRVGGCRVQRRGRFATTGFAGGCGRVRAG